MVTLKRTYVMKCTHPLFHWETKYIHVTRRKVNLIWCRRKKWNAYIYYNVGIYTSIKLMRICGNANKSFQCLSFYKEIYQRLSCRQILVSALISTLTFTTNFVFQVNKFQLLWIPNGQKYKVYERIKFA